MSFIILNKKDGTGRVGVSLSKLASIEEVLGANTTTQFTIVQLGGVAPKTYTVSESFHEIMKAMDYKRIDQSQTEQPPAGG